jgi:hypothetical protein
MSKLIPWAVALAAVVVLGGGWLKEVRHRQAHDLETERRLAALEQAAIADTRASGSGALRPFDADGRAAFVARVNGRMGSAGATSAGLAGRPSDAEVKRLQAQERARLESRFATDGSDPRWARETEAAATEAIVEPALASFDPPAGTDMRCARTMCRMTFTFNSAGAAADWATYYPLGLAGQLPVTQSQQARLADGSVRLVLYAFRDPKAKPFR